MNNWYLICLFQNKAIWCYLHLLIFSLVFNTLFLDAFLDGLKHFPLTNSVSRCLLGIFDSYNSYSTFTEHIEIGDQFRMHTRQLWRTKDKAKQKKYVEVMVIPKYSWLFHRNIRPVIYTIWFYWFNYKKKSSKTTGFVGVSIQ